jgi:Tfp pilus assembly protein PilF
VNLSTSNKLECRITKREFMPQISRTAILCAAIIVFASPAFCQSGTTMGSGTMPNGPIYQPAPVSGTVQVSTNNFELRNIKVTLSTSSGQPVDSIFTDTRGNFTFIAVPPGNYVVTIDADGFEPFREQVTVMGRPGPRVYAMLRVAKSEKVKVPGTAVSARELALPQKAQEALHKGLDALYTKHDPAGSLVHFAEVIQAAPEFYEAYYNEGVAYLKLNKQEEAEAALRKSIELSKETFADAYITLASMYADKDRFVEAEPLARQGLALQPDSYRGHYELARALFGEGLPVDAEQSALDAKKLQPNFARLYILLANIELRLGRNESVIQNLDTYLKLEPDGPYSAQAKQLKEKTQKTLGRSTSP